MPLDAPEIVPFEEKHRAFLFDSFRKSLKEQWPWYDMSPYALLDELKRCMSSPDVRALVAHAPGDADNYLAAIVSRPRFNEVIWAFTKFPYRRQFGVGSSLAIASGIDLTMPTGVRFWTRASERISQRPGYKLYHRVTEANDRHSAADCDPKIVDDSPEAGNYRSHQG